MNSHKSSLSVIRGIQTKEIIFKSSLFLGGIILIGGGLLLIGTLAMAAYPAISQFGGSFFNSAEWNPVFNEFGAGAFIYGTLLVACFSLLISTPLSLSIALMSTVVLKQKSVKWALGIGLDILAGIPSVVFGLWGMVVILPLIRPLQIAVGIPPYGVSVLSAILIVTMMIIPYASSLIRQVIRTMPTALIENAFALGATRIDVIKTIILPYAKSGIIAGSILALGRALGETMAVTMVIGNASSLPNTLLHPGNTIASVLANEFSEAFTTDYYASLMLLALALFLVTTISSMSGRWMIRWFQQSK
jgi:phosphate transport system permease protein